MGRWSKQFCPCGSGDERGFCSRCSHGKKKSTEVPMGTFRMTRGGLKPKR